MRSAIAIIGGGAAGYFAAIAAREARAGRGGAVKLFEATAKSLAKVSISGGGRCNVTHHCFDIPRFLESYPRGSRELRSVFSRFQARDTVDWFAKRGVELKAEADGRMFPVTDSSQTIIDCLTDAARQAEVRVEHRVRVKRIQRDGEGFRLEVRSEGLIKSVSADRLILATGGGDSGFRLAAELGHRIVAPVPSLFTFKVEDARLSGLEGISVPSARIELVLAEDERFRADGPLLVTHWGLSGPAILRLSAWAARELHRTDYRGTLVINWLGIPLPEIERHLLECKAEESKKSVVSVAPGVPRRLWQRLLEAAAIDPQKRWQEVARKELSTLCELLGRSRMEVSGKGVFKEE
ncbi:MAG: aminoacetone oxidase family FAD-binding enzyme, partial [Bdellovibrionales bacterium]|nr:aminoacetone oxidase family FAD-binding enzyme [Bdellovibrionales bacterium]